MDLNRRHFLKQITVGGLYLKGEYFTTESVSNQELSPADSSYQRSPVEINMIEAEKSIHPLLDFNDPQEFTRYQPIEDAGYFAVGRRYIHPPRVEWRNIQGVEWYELFLTQGNRILGITRAKKSPEIIQDGWDQIKVGKANILIAGYNTNGVRIALSRLFPIYVGPDYDQTQVPQPRRSYREAAWLSFQALRDFEWPSDHTSSKESSIANLHPVLRTAYISLDKPDNEVSRLCFPNLHDWCHVDMLENLVKIADDTSREQIINYARSVGNHLLLCRIPLAGNVYGGLVYSVTDSNCNPSICWRDPNHPELDEKLLHLTEPGKSASSALALIKIFDLTKDHQFLLAAQEMADVLVRTQQEDGSWPARVDARTGEVLGEYTTNLTATLDLFERLNKHCPNPCWIKAHDRVFSWVMAHPMKTYGWVANFEDFGALATKENPYKGLSNWDLFPFLRYLCHYPDRVDNSKAVILEQLHWNDNHFVFYGSDPLFPYEPYYPCCAEQGDPASYNYVSRPWLPMDFHTANWGRTLLAYYRLTGDKQWLERARAAGNCLTQYQLNNGYTMTWMCDRTFGVSALYASRDQTFWPAAWALSSAFWAELATFENI